MVKCKKIGKKVTMTHTCVQKEHEDMEPTHVVMLPPAGTGNFLKYIICCFILSYEVIGVLSQHRVIQIYTSDNLSQILSQENQSLEFCISFYNFDCLYKLYKHIHLSRVYPHIIIKSRIIIQASIGYRIPYGSPLT